MSLSLIMFHLFIFVSISMTACSFAQYGDLQVSGTLKNNPGSSSLVFPVEGDIMGDGAFSTTVYIGHPSKPYKLDIDTGSNITWVQCKPAGSGVKLPPAPHPPYIPKNKESVMLCKDPLCHFIEQPIHHPCKAPTDQCDYEVQYADQGSSLGVVVKDAFTLKYINGTIYTPTLAFGCGYDQEFSGGHAPFVDGVLGLANGKASIVSQLINFGASKNVIGHCFPSQGRGFLFIGDNHLPSGITWVPLLPNSQHGYTLGPADLLFDGNVTRVKGINVIFDSGSTYTYVNPKVYQATLALIKSGLRKKPITTVSDPSLPVCWKGPKQFKSIEQVKGYFSPLALIFTREENVRFELSPESYLVLTSLGNVCLGILDGGDQKLGDLNIIGDVSLLDKLVIYDNERHRVGWIPWKCNTLPNYLILLQKTLLL